ncbi:MAG: glycerophosphodiester phosphodiesterase [Alphaproteobacteria bacterium]|nr:glycerophosphodiester phosphodiesterase [Alphaproteobacteria bacterium]
MTIKVGHRGAAGHEPENTLRSFQKAIDFGVDMIECDVHSTGDGEVVVIHDDRVDRTTNGKGKVSQMTLAELKQLDAGKGERIATLGEALDFVAGKCKLIIEIKDRASAVPVAEIIKEKVLNKVIDWQDVLVESFDHHQILAVKRHEPRIPIAPILGGMPIGYAAFADDLPCEAISICVHNLTPEFVADARNRGKAVYVWTANHADDIAHAYSMGVDGITSDYPDRL